VELAAGRQVAAILLLDSYEHVPATCPLLPALREATLKLGRPHLVLSVPNVTHFDVGAKLAMGRWDETESGLLDRTHVRFPTITRLEAELAELGWAPLAQNDFNLQRSDQAFPSDHPALVRGTPLHDFLHQLRTRVDPHATVNQFIRTFAFVERAPVKRVKGTPAPFLSVLMRTQLKREPNLLEVLTCLGAQSSSDFELLLLVHSVESELAISAQRLVDLFAPAFSQRVRVIPVTDGGRARPLNVGLENARGRYVAFLDDDDLVTGDWVQAFEQGAAKAPGQMVRSITVDRRVARPENPDALAPYVSLGGVEFNHAPSFSMLEHVYTNATPICSFAVPMELVRALRLHFNEELPVLEDWAFLQQAALYGGVHDTGLVTSIYHRWESKESSLSTVPSSVWVGMRELIIQQLNEQPLLLPRGSASRIAQLQAELERLRSERGAHGSATGLEPRFVAVDRANQLFKTRAPRTHSAMKKVLRRLLKT
jgi:hypothetical protein